MLEDAFARFKAQIQAIKCPVMFFQHIHYPKGLKIVLKTPMVFHASVERFLPSMAEWRMTQIMRERNGFHQIFIKLKVAGDGAANLRNFQAVRQARAKQVSLMIYENLRLVLESPEGRRMNDPIPVALERGAPLRRFFGEPAPAGIRLRYRVRRQLMHGGCIPPVFERVLLQ